MTLIVAFALLLRPASYTATARLVAEERLLPQLASAELLTRLAAELEDSPEIQRDRRSRPEGAPIEETLQSDLVARRHALPGWLELQFTHEVPAVAAVVVNTAARLALQRRAMHPDEGALRALEASERALGAFDAAHPDAADPAQRLVALAREAADRSRQLEEVDARMDLLRGRLNALAEKDLDAVDDRRGMVRARQQLDRALLAQGALSARYGPRHQKMIAAAGEVAAADRLLAQEVEAAREQLERSLADLAAQRASLADAGAVLAETQAELESRSAEREALRLVQEQARRRYEQADVAADAIAEAPVPLRPDDPGYLFWLAGLFSAVALGVFLLQGLRR